MNLTPTLEQLQKFCAITTDRDEWLHPFLFRGYVYATDGHICVRIKDDGSLKIDTEIVTPYRNIDYAKIFEGEENCDLPIPPLPKRIKCKPCRGTAISHDCPDCDGDGGWGGTECTTCAGTGRVTPAADAPPCWHCNGRGEQEHNPVAVGDAHFNRIYLALAAEMPGARFVRIDGKNVARIKFDGGEIAVMPTRVR